MQNDTYGDISRDELTALRAVAKTCSRCGMLATVDPVQHESRYGHAPEYRASGRTYTWINYRFEAVDGPL